MAIKKQSMAKAHKKTKDPGRPVGAPNKGSLYVRDETLNMRVSEGFNKTLDALIKAGYKSKADAIHEALQLLAMRKLSDPVDLYWINKIM